MKIRSEERTTGMGADHSTRVLIGGEFVKVSAIPGARYSGREAGYTIYEVEMADDAISAEFHRSNSGKEEVAASNGMRWTSFSEAQVWATGKSTPSVCPCCGRLL